MRFKIGDHVTLSQEGRKELPRLRRRRGVVVGHGLTPEIVRVEWGRTRELWHNHQDNLEREKRGKV